MIHDATLADAFETHRPRLRAVAAQLLGSSAEAEDAVQETWLRLMRTDGVDNLGGWLTTVTSRICLDQLRARRAHPVAALPADEPPPTEYAGPPVADPVAQAELADGVGAALLVVLDRLTPQERLAFCLHDLFGVPFDEVGAVLDRSPDAARQLASRGRRKVRGADPDAPVLDADRRRRQAVVAAFLRASREGDLDGLLAVLAPDVALRGDATVVAMGAPAEVRGSAALAAFMQGKAKALRPGLLDGEPGAAWMHAGETRVLFRFTIADGQVTDLDLHGDPDTIAATDLRLTRLSAT